jgi:hypothetical protein
LRSRQAGLRDLRIVDAHGERVPYALLPVRPAAATEQRRAVALYPLPARRSASGTWGSEVAEVAREADAAAALARWRPWLLWGVLLVGVAALALMVLKLVRGNAGSGG